MNVPKTRYAKTGDAHVAYQVIGDGPVDAVWVGTWFGHVEARWNILQLRSLLEKLSRFTRLILFDKRGTGLSDPVPLTSLPTLEEWMDDVRAVMDAEGWERASILASGDGGPLGIVFAATYPDRTTALVLADTFARTRAAVDYPDGIPNELVDAYVQSVCEHWGSAQNMIVAAPSLANDRDFLESYGHYQRQCASPGTAAAMARMLSDIDVRSVLPAIRVPTLVTQRAGGVIPLTVGRHLADNIQRAQFVELPPGESLPFLGETEDFVGEIEEFLTGVRPTPPPERVLATVMFTDIVNSTARASKMGDHSWRALLERHHDTVRRELDRFRGKEVKTVGDGFLATFDGPARAIGCARSIGERLRGLDLQVRAGLHTGECEIIGNDVGGIAVHIAARVAAAAEAGQVLVSSTVKDLVAGSGITFDDQGMRTLKGVPDEWRLFAVSN